MCYVVEMISLASGICYLILIGPLTVRLCDLFDYKRLVIGQVKSDSFGVTTAKLATNMGC